MELARDQEWAEASSLIQTLPESGHATIVIDQHLAEHPTVKRVGDWVSAAGLTPQVVPLAASDDGLAGMCRVGAELTQGASVVVAVGGGSVIDEVKVSTVLSTVDETAAGHVIRDRCGMVMLPPTVRRPVPLIVVPTTLGTGAEVSGVSVYEAGDNRRLIVGQQLIPDASVLDEPSLRTLPAFMVGEGILEIFARLSSPFIDESATELTLADEVSLALVRRLAENAFDASPDRKSLLETARISRASHARILARIRNRVPLLWVISNEIIAVSGRRKMAVSLPLWTTLWQRMLDGDERIGSANRCRQIWEAVRDVDPMLPVCPVEGLAALQDRLELTYDTALSEQELTVALTRMQKHWGAGLPLLRGLTKDELRAIVVESFPSVQ